MKEELYNVLRQEMSEVHCELLKDIPADISLLQDVFEHIFNAGGKRLRALLTLAISKITASHTTPCAIYLAAAVELIHTATLLHDDVIDNAMVRRNARTANMIWDNKISILVGDNMFSKAFQLIVKSNKSRAFKELADASATISAAEVWQIQLLDKIDITIDEYIKLITEKTAVLFGAACAVGAITNDCSDETVKHARDFGVNLGISYQIKDDWLDYFGNAQVMGKEILQDIKTGKVTLPLIMLLRKISESDLKHCIEILKDKTIDSRKISEMMQKFAIETEVQSFSQQFKTAAIEALMKINNVHPLLATLAQFVNSI